MRLLGKEYRILVSSLASYVVLSDRQGQDGRIPTGSLGFRDSKTVKADVN